jgi:hypothetical protein
MDRRVNSRAGCIFSAAVGNHDSNSSVTTAARTPLSILLAHEPASCYCKNEVASRSMDPAREVTFPLPSKYFHSQPGTRKCPTRSSVALGEGHSVLRIVLKGSWSKSLRRRFLQRLRPELSEDGSQRHDPCQLPLSHRPHVRPIVGSRCLSILACRGLLPSRPKNHIFPERAGRVLVPNPWITDPTRGSDPCHGALHFCFIRR